MEINGLLLLAFRWYAPAGKGFDDDLDLQRANDAHLIGCDLDIDHPEVRGVPKPISGDVFPDWMAHVARRQGRVTTSAACLHSFLMRHLPQLALTVVEPWFKPLASAFILLRREGEPCLFLPN